jgi:hypothetical protein
MTAGSHQKLSCDGQQWSINPRRLVDKLILLVLLSAQSKYLPPFGVAMIARLSA